MTTPSANQNFQYLPMQYNYNDWIPSQSYYAFATHAGCAPTWAYGNSSQTIFQCLVAQNTTTLQLASFAVSASGTYGTWGFLPVTDGVFVQERPSVQLLQKRVNGQHLLVGVSSFPLFPTRQQEIPFPLLGQKMPLPSCRHATDLAVKPLEQRQRGPALHDAKHYHRGGPGRLVASRLPAHGQQRHRQDPAVLPVEQRVHGRQHARIRHPGLHGPHGRQPERCRDRPAAARRQHLRRDHLR